MDCRKFWKQYIQDYTECAFDEINLTNKQVKTVINKLLDDDELYNQIDYYVSYHIEKTLAGH